MREVIKQTNEYKVVKNRNYYILHYFNKKEFHKNRVTKNFDYIKSFL